MNHITAGIFNPHANINDMTTSATNSIGSSPSVPSAHALDFVGEESADASILCDAKGGVVAWSKGAEEILGWNAREAIGKPIVDLIVPPQRRSMVAHAIEQFYKTGDHGCLNRHFKAVLLDKDRRAIRVQYLVTAVHLKKHRYFSVSIWDHAWNKERDFAPRTSMLHLSRDAIIVTDIESKILFWNEGAERMFGYSEQEALGRKSHELLAAHYPIDIKEIEQQLVTGGHWEGEVVYTTRAGTSLPTLSRWALERDADKGDPRILISNTDINVLKKHLEASMFIKADGQSFNALFGFHPDGVLAFNVQGQLTAANPAISVLTGYSNKELLAIPIEQLVAPEDLAKLRFNFEEALHGKPETHEFCCIKKNKTRFDASITMLPHVVNNKIDGLHVIVKDVSHRKLDERRILYLATHDPLTGLANRNLLNDRMQHAIEQARRMQTQIGILFMDLDRFKVINDSLGHDKGDILLCTIADRLKGAVREVDTVARLGGDEFVVLLENINASGHVSTVAKNLIALVRQPVEIEGDVITISTSIGASIYPQDGNEPASLLKNADLAMYEAKRSGSGMFRFYTAEMNAKALGQLARENSLRRAIDQGELVLHYQPRLDIVKNELVGVEALARWEHPEKGLILPANFIPLAEEIGVIDALGEWVLLTACRQLKAWQDSGMFPIKMSVNVSAIQLRSDTLFDAIESALADTDLDPRYLELEITESSLMQDLDTSYNKLMKIRNLGISLSIDDFGTGYSSLSYLKRLPIDTLKIDKSFIRDIPENIDDSAIVSATIAMAHSMNLRVVAEGVTSFDQVRFLDSCHCDEIQGYLLCQPLPSLDTESFFKTSQLRGIYYSWAH
jgi:diguanylate cyclase (GGDEF)-like protein/PAS domain S-box-containing protein